MPSAQTVVSAYEAMQSSTSVSPRPERRRRAGSILQVDSSQRDLMRLAAGAQTPRIRGPSEPRDLLCVREQHRLFEYMCVCGIARPQLPLTAEVLAAVPTTALVPPELAAFVFPDRTPLCRAIDANAHEPPAEQQSAGLNTYLLCLNSESATPLYVFVVRVREIFEQPAAWVPAGRVAAGALLSGLHVTERAYCIASHNPYAHLFWKLLWVLGRIEHARMTTDDPVRRERQVKKARAFVDMMQVLSAKVYRPGDIIKIINRALLPEELVYPVPGETQSLRSAVSAVCLPVLMRALSPQNVALVMGALLTGTRVLVLGAEPGRVSACVLALAAAMAPFAWQGLLWPLLAHAHSAYLEAPVPYIAGLVSTGQRAPGGIDQPLAVVCIDSNSVSVAHGSLPEMPAAERLVTTLLYAHERIRRGLTVHNNMCADPRPFDKLDDDHAFCSTSAHEALGCYTVWLIAQIRTRMPDEDCFDDSSVAAVLEKTSARFRPFVQAVLDTQHWQLLATTFDSLTVKESGSGGSAYEDQTV